ncbi:MAG TPA: diiron oxygenase, partial [Acidimicrobiales bacterium]|nr:diiron oxygenase [Acidimicrobiales bacterium]
MTITAPAIPEDLSAQHAKRVERLNTASVKRVIEPDTDVAGSIGVGQVVSRRMLSVYGLDLDLTDEQWVRLSREEMASVFDAGVRFESTLMANFGLSLAYRKDLTDPRVTYMLHEIGEETRHSRLFIRVISQLQPTAKNPFNGWMFKVADRVVGSWALRHDAAFMVMILFGEEGPDLLQKLAVEDSETDPFIKEVNRYHRSEEARHLSFAR